MKTLQQILDMMMGIEYEDPHDVNQKEDLLRCGYKHTGRKVYGYDVYCRENCVIWYDAKRDEIVNWQKSVT